MTIPSEAVALTEMFGKCGIYFLVKNDRVVYVGQSQMVHRRVGGHRPRIDFDAAFVIEADPEDLNDLENRWINVLRPPLNKRLVNVTEFLPPKPRFHFFLPNEHVAKLKRLSAEKDVSMSEMIRGALDSYLTKEGA